MSPLPQAVYTERPKLAWSADRWTLCRGRLPSRRRVPPSGRPGHRRLAKSAVKPGIGGGPHHRQQAAGHRRHCGGPTSTVDPFTPTKTGGARRWPPHRRPGSVHAPPTHRLPGYPDGDGGYSSGLAGAAPDQPLAAWVVASAARGRQRRSRWRRRWFAVAASARAAGSGRSGGGLGGGGGIGVGGIPGMVGGGNGKMPPMTSAANALRTAAGRRWRRHGGRRAWCPGVGGAGMMGGGMMGGAGGAGHGGGTGSEHSSWLTEDDDPWGPGDGASPGVLR